MASRITPITFFGSQERDSGMIFFHFKSKVLSKNLHLYMKGEVSGTFYIETGDSWLRKVDITIDFIQIFYSIT